VPDSTATRSPLGWSDASDVQVSHNSTGVHLNTMRNKCSFLRRRAPLVNQQVVLGQHDMRTCLI